MIDYIKSILGIASDFTDYDLYLAVICAVGLIGIAKCVISGIYTTITSFFR